MNLPKYLQIFGGVIYRVSQKNVLSWKNGHNYLQNHKNAKVGGVLENSGYFLLDVH